ncbi:hypothetical protein PENTCL1PPCAC_27769, partial [Pristionchus entomophagus]
FRCQKFVNQIVRHLQNKKSLCMKAFSVILAILLHSLLGVAIACPVGSEGPLCEEKCTKDCNSGQCAWRNETQVCICEEAKWTGANCEVARPCSDVKCNHGRCEQLNSTLIFICVCNDGYKGKHCDVPIIDLCIGQSKISCENGATCVDNKCVCEDGFGGELCENIVPKLSEYESSRCSPSCAAIFANNKCDEECNTAECFYDGLDCYERPEIADPTWIDTGSHELLSPSTQCLQYYGNGICNKDCNSGLYGFDGGDCEKELRGTVKSQIQISLNVKPSDVYLSKKSLLAYLAQILRAAVSISESKLDGRPEVFSTVSATGAEERIALDSNMLLDRYNDYTTMILDVDASHCSDNTCLQLNGSDKTIQSAIVLLDTYFVRSKRHLEFPALTRMNNFTVEDVKAPEESAVSWIEIFVTVIISMCATLLFALLIIACWLIRRRRRCLKTTKDGACHGWIGHHKNRLVTAVEEGNVSSLTSLLSETSPIEAANAEDESGNTVLHMAASRDDKEVVKLLLQSMMFDVCSVNSVGQSPLLYSLKDGKPGLETLTLLVNAINDAKLRQRTTSQGTPRAATSHLMLTALSEEPGWGLTDAVGRSALHHAAMVGRPRHIIHFLVSHGASPGLQDASGNTPLHLASINGHSETVNALLDERASVTITNTLGNTPAKVGELNGHLNLAALLFEREEAVISAPLRSRHDSQRATMYSTNESIFSDEPDEHELVLPSLLSSFNAFNDELAACSLGAMSENGCDGGGGGRLSLSGLGSGGPNSTLSGSVDGLLQTTPRPSLPHILTPSSQLVEVSPERDAVPTTLPRKSLFGVERSPSDPRPSQLTTPYGATYGKRRSLPDGPSIPTITGNYRDVLLSPVHFTYASNTMSTTSERSQSSAGHDSLVSSFRPPPLS